ncbi:hypothetical protein AAHC03_013794 [Spirometra sp. Aus1]
MDSTPAGKKMQFCGGLRGYIQKRMMQPDSQRRMVLVIVSIALLLDNMLYMVIVPIIPDYLRAVDVLQRREHLMANLSQNKHFVNYTGKEAIKFSWLVPEAEDAKIGMLFAFKAIVQLFFNPLSGYVIDRIGYDIPMVIGLSVIFVSTSIFAFGKSFGVMFLARGLQGAGSAFADTAGLAMIADRYTEESERTMALGIALAFISFGCLFAPPFGGVLYQFLGKEFPFLILAFLALLDGFLVMVIMKPVRMVRMELQVEGALPKPTPIYKLLRDPYIMICAGALAVANISLAFLEPTIAIWMQDTMQATNSQAGLIWLPAFVPHVLGVYTTVRLADRYPHYQWLMAAVGLALDGISCVFIPLCTNFVGLMFPICVLCYGIALIDTAILPNLAYLVDTRHASVYGSVYAIADISYSVAYAIGPMVAGGLLSFMNFTGLNISICVVTCAYVPVLYLLRKSYLEEPEKALADGAGGESGAGPERAARRRLTRQETARFEPAGCKTAPSQRANTIVEEVPEHAGYEQQDFKDLRSLDAKPTYTVDRAGFIPLARNLPAQNEYLPDTAGYGYGD